MRQGETFVVAVIVTVFLFSSSVSAHSIAPRILLDGCHLLPPIADKGDWMAVLEGDATDSAELRPVSLKQSRKAEPRLKNAKVNCVGIDPASLEKPLPPPSSANAPVYTGTTPLLRGLNLKPGKLDRASITDWQEVGSHGAGRRFFRSFVMMNGREWVLHMEYIGSDTYILTLKEEARHHVFFEARGKLGDAMPQLIWAGDLDRDGEVDLIMNAPKDHDTVHIRVFLSSATTKKAMLKEVADLKLNSKNAHK